MTKTGFVLKRSAAQIIKNPAVSGIIVFALTVSCFAALILTASVADRCTELREISELKKQYYFCGEDPTGARYDKNVTDSPKDGKYPIFNRLFSDDFPEVDSFLSLEVTLSGGKIISAVYSGEYPAAAEMAEGRGYSAEELSGGENVAVVNISECEDVKIGENVRIGDAEFRLIGKTYGVTSVPLFAAFKEGWSVKFGDVTFKDFLSSEQEALLVDILSSDGVCGLKTGFEMWSASDYSEIKRAIFSLIILIIISGIIIAKVFGYSVDCRLREFNIYKTLGIRGAELFAIFYLPPLIILGISLVLGGLLFKLSYLARNLLGITQGFTPAVASLALILAILLMIAVTLPRYIKILRQDPKDGEGLT